MLQALACAPGAAPPPVRMMLANDELRVVLVTIHLSLRDAIDGAGLRRACCRRCASRTRPRGASAWPRRASRWPGSTRMPAKAACSATRSSASSRPAIAAARAEGIDARGPFAPDTVFMRARDAAGKPGEFDLVVAMTHDHGLIPVKYLGVEQGVNVTLGLPFVRTSPDHGTAFDIAGRGRADPASLEAAIRMARRLSEGQA